MSGIEFSEENYKKVGKWGQPDAYYYQFKVTYTAGGPGGGQSETIWSDVIGPVDPRHRAASDGTHHVVAHTRTDEHGFSLTELMVVVSLLGMILAISYGGLLAIYKAREVSDRQAAFAQEVAAPLTHMEKILTQTLVIENPGPYTVTVLTDRDNNNLVERHTIEARSDGTLRHRTWQTEPGPGEHVAPVRLPRGLQHNANQAQNTPLVIYYDSDHQRINNMADVAGEAAFIDIHVVVDYEGRYFDDTRSSLLRNMN